MQWSVLISNSDDYTTGLVQTITCTGGWDFTNLYIFNLLIFYVFTCIMTFSLCLACFASLSLCFVLINTGRRGTGTIGSQSLIRLSSGNRINMEEDGKRNLGNRYWTEILSAETNWLMNPKVTLFPTHETRRRVLCILVLFVWPPFVKGIFYGHRYRLCALYCSFIPIHTLISISHAVGPGVFNCYMYAHHGHVYTGKLDAFFTRDTHGQMTWAGTCFSVRFSWLNSI